MNFGMSVGKSVSPDPSSIRGLRRLSFSHYDHPARVKNLRILDRRQQPLINDLEPIGLELIVKVRRQKPLRFAKIFGHSSFVRLGKQHECQRPASQVIHFCDADHLLLFLLRGWLRLVITFPLIGLFELRLKTITLCSKLRGVLPCSPPSPPSRPP